MTGASSHEQAIQNGLRLTVAALLVGSLLLTAIPAATANHVDESDNDQDRTNRWPQQFTSKTKVKCWLDHEWDGDWYYAGWAYSYVKAYNNLNPLFIDWEIGVAVSVPGNSDWNVTDGTELPPYKHDDDLLKDSSKATYRRGGSGAYGWAYQEDARTDGLVIEADARASVSCTRPSDDGGGSPQTPSLNRVLGLLGHTQ